MKTIFLSTTCLIVALSSCKSESNPIVANQSASNETQSVIQPIKGLEVANRTFLIDSQKDEIIKLPSGGSIEFSANSFIDKEGNPVNGKIEIQWKEYHSLTDILLSGIPMKYDSSGVEYDFVSGGMFTIKATNEGSEVDLAKGKTATVNLASYVDTPCFNFYELNEKTGDWTYETTKVGTKMDETTDQKNDLKNKEVKPKEDILDVTVNLSKFPELEKQHVVAWKTKDKLTYQTKRLLKEELNDIQLESAGNGLYKMNVKNTKLDVSINVEPITLAQANSQKRDLLEKMDDDFKDILAYQSNYEAGKILRSIEIPGMGTYNWDKVLKRNQQQYLAATFNLQKEINHELVSIFFISPVENVVIECHSHGEFNFDPSLPNYLVAILPDNSILMVDRKDFSGANKAKPGSKYEFVFNDIHRKVTSPSELAELLQGIMSPKS